MIEAACPACGGFIAVRFFDGGERPLATLALPETSEASLAMKRLPHAFVRCVACGHVFNARFDFREVPHAEPPRAERVGWGMYNRGSGWSAFLRELAARIATRLPARALVVEIGHGEGTLLEAILRARPDARGLGFDPHGAEHTSERLELRRAPALPEALPDYGADFLVARHVLEHLPSPLAFLQRTALAATRPLPIFVEVPCIDRAIAARRTTDFFYEHYSHFTARSFRAMLERAGASAIEVELGYDEEVIFAFATLDRSPLAEEALAFEEATRDPEPLRAQLRQLCDQGEVVIWGGTGKSAAFLARYGTGRELVVDSDPRKIGTFVPGAAQPIVSPERARAPFAIVIPPQWRARDIVSEIRARGIRCDRIYIEHEGALIDFTRGLHPYAR